jgi:AraC-like DNA-binding protein
MAHLEPPHGTPATGTQGVGADAPVPCVTYTTSGLPPAAQFAAWRDRCLPVVEMTSTPEGQDGYRASAQVWTVGRFALSRVVAEAAGYRRSTAMLRGDGLDQWVLNMSLSGRHRFRRGGQETVLEPRMPHLFSLAASFEGDRDDIDWVAIFIPREVMPERAGLLDPSASGVIEGALGRVLGATLERIVESLPRMTVAELPQLEATIAGLLAGCLALPRRDDAAGKSEIEAARRARALAIIRRELGSPMLGPAEICKLADMSRSQLYRCFAPLGGVARAIQSERLTRAHAALLASDGKTDIGRTGERFGFPDASTFSRAFRREFGCTPSQLVARQLALAAAEPPAPAAPGLAAALAQRPGGPAQPRATAGARERRS